MPQTAPPALEVTGVSHQADWIRPGQAFVAIKGARFDGHGFIGDAVERGAVAPGPGCACEAHHVRCAPIVGPRHR